MTRRTPILEKILFTTLAGVGVAAAATHAVRYRRRFDFRNKVVLITGGSRGLGLVMARRFAAEGAKVAICARDGETLADAVDDLAGRGPGVMAFTCDVTSREQVDEMVADVAKRMGGIDVLVNNAGVISVGPMETMTVADYEEAIRTHFYGPLYTALAVLPHLRKRGGGRIVNIASVGGKVAVPHLLPYSASKFALVGFSEGLRAELQGENIYVTTVCPGLMRTGSPPNAFFKGQHRREYEWFHVADSLPLISVNADRAARRIVNACRDGRAELIFSIPAKAATVFNALFPGLSTQIGGCVNATVLPKPGGIGESRALGKDSETPLTQSGVTELSRAAGEANNEI